ILQGSQLCLGQLSTFDVGEQRVPPNDPPTRIPKRKPPNLKPTVDPVEAADMRIEIIWFARRNCPGKDFDDIRKIVNVNRPVRAPRFHLFQTLTAVLNQSLVNEFNLAGC